jgi:DNA-binding response OmpR family regulator
MGPVEVASDVQLALGASLAPCPALVLLDADSMGDNVWMTVRRTKAKWPGARTIVLTGNDQQQQEAESAGADVVLPNGFPAGRLVAAILKLLPHPAV